MRAQPRPPVGGPTASGRTQGDRRVAQRRFRRINLVTALPLLGAVGTFLVVRQAQTWVDGLVLGLGLVATLVTFERWSAGDSTRVALPALVLTSAVWVYGALVMPDGVQGAFYGLAFVGALTIPRLPRHRALAGVLFVALVGGVGLAGVLGGPLDDTGRWLSELVVPTGVAAAMLGLMYPNKGFYDMVAELEEAREREAELAVVRERIRFASDLHDIQGHTLHVVKLKTALARKLVSSDPARAEQELSEIYELVGDTINQTKELAYGQRRLNLTAELENARNLFEAAGIHVRVDRQGEVPGHAIELLAQVLRETTTNVLRHSRATVVQVALTADGLTIINDGAAGADADRQRLRGGGLATLADRVAESGGQLDVDVDGDRFRTAVTFAGPGVSGASDSPPTRGLRAGLKDGAGDTGAARPGSTAAVVHGAATTSATRGTAPT